MNTTTRVLESTALPSTPPIHLLLAFELGERSWKLGFTTGLGQRPRIRQVPAGAVDRVVEEVVRAKRRLKLPPETPVIRCYEAVRDGFWLHRALVAQGVTNHVVDSSSIEVNRRARRAKTDNLDLAGLLTLLARYLAGDHRAWRVVRVPSVAEEDARHLHRTWETVQQDRTRMRCRLQGRLITHGIRLPITDTFLSRPGWGSSLGWHAGAGRPDGAANVRVAAMRAAHGPAGGIGGGPCRLDGGPRDPHRPLCRAPADAARCSRCGHGWRRAPFLPTLKWRGVGVDHAVTIGSVPRTGFGRTTTLLVFP